MKSLETLDINSWEGFTSQDVQQRALLALEQGKILYLPRLSFSLDKDEINLLSPHKADPSKKNISYDVKKNQLAGALCQPEEMERLKAMIKRYALSTRSLLEALIPHYSAHLLQAKTSFRPVEVEQRKTSVYKDDTLLHVDAFPSNPVKGHRILRVFTNINPIGKPRVWRVGEPFEQVVRKMAPRVSAPFPGLAYLLRLFKVTKDYRSPYDHYMLHIHNNMKKDTDYQKTVSQEEIQFPVGSSWIVYTDQVSHAAMSGQHLLEQTFYLPWEGLYTPSTAPIKVLERFLKRSLI